MVPKKLITYRIDASTEAKIAELVKVTGMSQAAVISSAVDRLYARKMREPDQALSALRRQFPELPFDGEQVVYVFELAEDGTVEKLQILKGGSYEVIHHKAGENE
jgi:hypothetical protein